LEKGSIRFQAEEKSMVTGKTIRGKNRNWKREGGHKKRQRPLVKKKTNRLRRENIDELQNSYLFGKELKRPAQKEGGSRHPFWKKLVRLYGSPGKGKKQQREEERDRLDVMRKSYSHIKKFQGGGR